MTYRVVNTPEADEDFARLAKNEPKVFIKAQRFIEELREHPRSGTGHPEPLKGHPEGRWSRRLSKKHRMVYRIFDDEVLVLLLSSYGHYDDK